MAHVINYNKTIHDLYTYDSEPIIDFAGSTFSWARPIGFNQNLYLKNITAYVPNSNLPTDLDFSGIVARRRGAAFYFTGNEPDVVNFGYFNGFQANSPPFPVSSQVFANNNLGLRQALYDDGWCGAYPNILEDYNYWNTGDIPGCLISPMHIVVGGHMIDPLWNGPTLGNYFNNIIGSTVDPFIQVRFIGKNNTVYDKTAYLSFWLNDIVDGECGNAGYDLDYDVDYCQNNLNNLGITFGESKDLAILELTEPFTQQELENVKIYKIANQITWPSNLPMFIVTPNGAVLTWKKPLTNLAFTESYYTYNTYPDFPVAGYQLLDGTGGMTGVFSNFAIYGDSCNFAYGYYPPTKETVFLGSTTQSHTFDYTNSILYDTVFLKALKKWIYDRNVAVTGTGYHISWIDYSNTNSAIQVEGEVLPLVSRLPAGSTQAFYSGMTIGTVYRSFTAGITYNFIVTAQNSAGYSGWAGPVEAKI